MTGDSPRPSSALIRLLRLVSSAAAANAAGGDILEELDERRAAGRAPRWTAFWLNCRILRSVLASITAATPRFVRSSGHTLRDAARALRRAPAHALFILLILAVAIAAATVTFSVVDAVVLRPLPFDHAEAIVELSGRDVRGPTSLAPEEFWAIHDGVAAFDSLASVRSWKTPVTAGGTTRELAVTRSTAELFRVLRLKPLIGQVWTTDDEARGDMHVAVISFALWHRGFGGEPAALGRTLGVDDAAYRVVGVLPAGPDSPGMTDWTSDVWIPQVPSRVGTPNGVSRSISAIGRVRDGVSFERVMAEAQSAVAPLAAAKPYAYTDWRPEVKRWHDALVGDVRGWMLLVLGAVALVVLIGCANAANVMLIRSTERSRELAVRASLGASRRQIAISLVAESLMLSIGATVCGLVFALWGVGAARAALPDGIFRVDAIGLNARVFAASILAAIGTGLLFGTVPAWQASRVSVVALLKDGGTTVTAGRRAWRSALLIAEVSCVCVLLVVSTLFVASFVLVTRVDLGVDRTNLLAVSPLNGFNGTVDEVQTRLKGIPFVADVAVVTGSSLPLVGQAFGGGSSYGKLLRADADAGQAPSEVQMYRVTPNYFAVTGMAFRRGSTWPAATALASPPIVLDELAARSLFGDRDPVGLHIRHVGLKDLFTVVGVVPSVYANGAEREARPSAYLAIPPNAARRSANLFVRTTSPPIGLVTAVEAALAPLAPPGRAPYVHAVDEAVRTITATRRFNATLMSAFAVFAMLIGGAGIYAVMASVVGQRTREIGLRMALGATTRDIRRDVLGQTGRHLGFGLAAGLPIAWWISRGFGALFFQVRPTDLSVYVIVAVTLAAIALVAAVVPARRASRVDPIVSLRAN
jgi:putative ABC transport system permease protein